ncbi:MAG: hypothetical protein WBA07_04885 [Rivularia sp. (in: cyanobacteria)]
MSNKNTRLSVMVPRDCKDDIEYILTQTGIKSNGELFKLMLARYREDFIEAYNQFFTPANIQKTSQPKPETVKAEIESKPKESKPITSAMSF